MFAKFAIRLARADSGMEIGGELASSQLGGSVLPSRLAFTYPLMNNGGFHHLSRIWNEKRAFRKGASRRLS